MIKNKDNEFHYLKNSDDNEMKFRFFKINKQFHYNEIRFLCEGIRFRFFKICKQFHYNKIEFLYEKIRFRFFKIYK